MIRWLASPAWDQVAHYRRLWLYVIAILVMIILVAPTLIVIPMSFSDSKYLQFPPTGWSLDWYRTFFQSSTWLRATQTSLVVAVFTVLVATPLGTLAAYAIHESKLAVAPAVHAILLSPMMVPVIMVAVGLYFIYARLELLNTKLGLVLAHAMLAIPLVVITVLAGLKTYDMNQERVARSLGAPRWLAFWTVTLPQIRPAILNAVLLSFLTSLDEVNVALFISGGDNSTVTRVMFNSLRDEIDPVITVVSTCLVLVSVTIVLVVQLVNRKSTQ